MECVNMEILYSCKFIKVLKDFILQSDRSYWPQNRDSSIDSTVCFKRHKLMCSDGLF